MQTERKPVAAPPPGFRKPIPLGVKNVVLIRGGARCWDCGEPLEDPENTEYDHHPATQLRQWDEAVRDTIPACNDPEFIVTRHVDCHKRKTTGRKGESDKNRAHGDIAQIAKLRRLEKEQAAYRQRLLAKTNPESTEEETRKKPASRWPKRAFNSRGSRDRPRGDAGADQDPT